MSRNKNTSADEEVEDLLRAAEDEIVLKLSLNSHMSSGSSSHIIHPDLDRRFQALKSKPSKSKPSKPNPPPTTTTNPQPLLPNPLPQLPTSSNKSSSDTKGPNFDDVDDDDLFARFAALKGIPSLKRDRQVKLEGGSDEDEVDKVIQWAIDSARLDPSPPSDIDEDDDDHSEDDDDHSENDDDHSEDDDDHSEDDDDGVVNGKKKVK